MPDREKIIAKLEKEVKKTYSIKTTIYNNGKKVSEDITEHREPGIKMSMETADEILALLKEQEAKTGKWIPVTNGRGGMECSICHDYAPSYQNGTEYLSKYCPRCGAKMKRR